MRIRELRAKAREDAEKEAIKARILDKMKKSKELESKNSQDEEQENNYDLRMAKFDPLIEFSTIIFNIIDKNEMAKGKKLLSESRLIKDGRTTCLYDIDITDELGTKIAFVTISGMKIIK